jgi:single-strand DNA-binding protein
MAFCSLTFVGNLGRDPELRYTPAGKAVTQFSVAVSSSKPDGSGGWKDEHTDWFRVSVWGDRGERAAEQLRKGAKVLVSGRFATREWQGKDDGATHTSLEVTADYVMQVGAPRSADGGTFGQDGIQLGAAGPDAQDDDLSSLPF